MTNNGYPMQMSPPQPVEISHDGLVNESIDPPGIPVLQPIILIAIKNP